MFKKEKSQPTAIFLCYVKLTGNTKLANTKLTGCPQLAYTHSDFSSDLFPHQNIIFAASRLPSMSKIDITNISECL